MSDDSLERRWHAMRECERILSGRRPHSLREQIAALAESGYDLDNRADFYGDGPVRELEDRVAALLGKPAAVFFPTGTMAQQIALRCWAERSGNWAVAMHPLSHLQVHERQAYATVTGLRAIWPTRQPRQPTAAEIRELDEPFGSLLVELPLRDAGYLLPAWDELVELVTAARERGARVHLDGARLWESLPYLAHDLPQIAELADSVYVSFYKTLGGQSGAALAGPAELVTQARAWRHRYGGQLFQQWPAALAALAGLDRHLHRLADYVAHAAVVADALATPPGARVYPNPPHTHQFRLWLPHPADQLDEAVYAMAAEERVWVCGGWTDDPGTGMARTEITVAESALDWTAAEVTEAVTRLLKRLPG
ncbi:MAG TPA: beta-eliminating lyase-related protein [Actinomycetes bacterium]|nr:beta-eliminating lyase-related protein [Actinomycetes bacterium]